MIEETLLILIITGIIAICTYCVKNVKTSDCWSKEHCIKCTMKKQQTVDDTDSIEPKVDLKNGLHPINESHI